MRKKPRRSEHTESLEDLHRWVSAQTDPDDTMEEASGALYDLVEMGEVHPGFADVCHDAVFDDRDEDLDAIEVVGGEDTMTVEAMWFICGSIREARSVVPGYRGARAAAAENRKARRRKSRRASASRRASRRRA